MSPWILIITLVINGNSASVSQVQFQDREHCFDAMNFYHKQFENKDPHNFVWDAEQCSPTGAANSGTSSGPVLTQHRIDPYSTIQPVLKP